MNNQSTQRLDLIDAFECLVMKVTVGYNDCAILPHNLDYYLPVGEPTGISSRK